MPAGIIVSAFPQRLPPRHLAEAACGGLSSAPDYRTRRALLHLSYSCVPPILMTVLVSHGQSRLNNLRDPSAVAPTPDHSPTGTMGRTKHCCKISRGLGEKAGAVGHVTPSTSQNDIGENETAVPRTHRTKPGLITPQQTHCHPESYNRHGWPRPFEPRAARRSRGLSSYTYSHLPLCRR